LFSAHFQFVLDFTKTMLLFGGENYNYPAIVFSLKPSRPNLISSKQAATGVSEQYLE
jgi:hypothetical protein